MDRSALKRHEALSPGLKVGLFGGSFNPGHAGHWHVAETARRRLGLDRVLWLVSPGNPLKNPDHWENYDERVMSAQDVIDGQPNHRICESEWLGNTRYTAETLAGFLQRWPQVHFVWVMGADNLHGFHDWRDWQEIALAMPICVVARQHGGSTPGLSRFAQQFARYRLPEEQAQGLAGLQPPAWTLLHAPVNPLSSTALRHESTMA